jgi:hypothetical protein
MAGDSEHRVPARKNQNIQFRMPLHDFAEIHDASFWDEKLPPMTV